jgi:hypothetical protein
VKAQNVCLSAVYQSPNLVSERRIRDDSLLCTKSRGLPVLTLYKNIFLILFVVDGAPQCTGKSAVM